MTLSDFPKINFLYDCEVCFKSYPAMKDEIYENLFICVHAFSFIACITNVIWVINTSVILIYTQTSIQVLFIDAENTLSFEQ